MDICQLLFGSVRVTEKASFGPGAHLVTGPSGSGKSRFRQALVWAMTGLSSGPKLPPGALVEVAFPGIGHVKRSMSQEAAAVEVLDQDGVVSDDPAGMLLNAGFLPCALRKGSSCLVGDLPPEPDKTVVVEGKRYSLDHTSSARVREDLQKRFLEYAGLISTKERVNVLREKIAAEREGMTAELLKMREQDGVQNNLSLLHLMDSGECPLYHVTCACGDKNIAKVKDEVRGRVAGKKEIPGHFEAVRKLEYEITRKQLYLDILASGPIDGEEKPIEERIAELKIRVDRGKAILAAAERREQWAAKSADLNRILSLKDDIIQGARTFGLDLTFLNGFKMRGLPVESASRSEKVALDYVVQKASGSPVIIIDDFDALDITWKTKMLEDAGKSDRTVIFLASSSIPRMVPSATCWHIDHGRLVPVVPKEVRQAA